MCRQCQYYHDSPQSPKHKQPKTKALLSLSSRSFARERNVQGHRHEKTDSEVTSLASHDLVAAAEAGVLRAESVTGLARRREVDDGVVPFNAGAEPGGVASALSLLLHCRPPLPRVLLQPIFRRISPADAAEKQF